MLLLAKAEAIPSFEYLKSHNKYAPVYLYQQQTPELETQ